MKLALPLRNPAVGLAALAAASALLYLGFSAWGGGLGFPLDDAWIHQTYGRSLGLRGEFAFLPGRPSAGSTAPLWSALLAVGYALRLEPLAWTYLLGGAALAANAWLTWKLAGIWWPGQPSVALLAGAAVALEWHLAWAAVSGMETLLFTALVLAVFVCPPDRPAWVGVLAGLSVFVRPDGLTVLPFALLRLALEAGQERRQWFFRPLAGAVGFALLFLPYLTFNLLLGGSAWPNTLYAKQAEYAALSALPLADRIWRVGQQPFLGGQILAVPGVLAAAWGFMRRRRWAALLPVVWAAGYVGAFVLRLPVTYQYGRYVMPVIPVVLAMGVGGLAGWLRPQSPRLWERVAGRSLWAALGVAGLAFWIWGAFLYRRDVRIIETEMVAAARWVAGHTPAGAVIGAHDIGALGYFGGRPVLDLAGLVSPDVIPFIRDEARLRVWLDESGCQYLMTFPGWYPGLVAPVAGQAVYRSAGTYSPAAGGENMVIYRWPGSLESPAPR